MHGANLQWLSASFGTAEDQMCVVHGTPYINAYCSHAKGCGGCNTGLSIQTDMYPRVGVHLIMHMPITPENREV